MNKVKNTFNKNFDLILLFLFCLALFSFLLMNYNTDIQSHIGHSLKINSTTKSYPANFLFYFLLNLLSGFSNNLNIIYVITVLLLSTSAVAKYVVSKKIIVEIIKKVKNQINNKTVVLMAIGLFFCFAIPDPIHLFLFEKMYLGKFVPTVWHNSTIITVFPFAILLFWKQLKVFETGHKTSIKEIMIINILVILNIIIKPSFIFVYMPITFIFLIYYIRLETIKTFILKLTPLFIGSLSILLQYYLIYNLQKGSIQKESSSIALSSPFEILLNWVPFWFIPISLFTSFALPIITMILYREIIKYKPFIYSVGLTIFGILISAFLKELGPRLLDGNFMWQNIICSYLLFLSTISFLIPRFLNNNLKTYKIYLLKGLFFIHALSGILYIIKTLLTKSYY